MIMPIVTINGSRLGDDQTSALAMAVAHMLEDLLDNAAFRERCKGEAQNLRFDLGSVLAMMKPSLDA